MAADQSAILTDFTTTIRQWIAWLDNYSLAKLTQQPQPNSWSLGQVYVHIIGDTSYYIGQVKIALQDRDNLDKQMHDDARVMLANNSFPDRQLQTPSDADLPQPVSKEELQAGLSALLQEVDTIMATGQFLPATGKAPHPGFGYLSALEWLQLAAMHLRHHFRQKARIDAVLFADS